RPTDPRDRRSTLGEKDAQGAPGKSDVIFLMAPAPPVVPCSHSGIRGPIWLLRLREIVPRETKVTVLADRGFGDQKLYTWLGGEGLDYAIRFRECIQVTDAK